MMSNTIDDVSQIRTHFKQHYHKNGIKFTNHSIISTVIFHVTLCINVWLTPSATCDVMLLVTLNDVHSQPQKLIGEMCCLRVGINLITWVEIIKILTLTYIISMNGILLLTRTLYI